MNCSGGEEVLQDLKSRTTEIEKSRSVIVCESILLFTSAIAAPKVYFNLSAFPLYHKNGIQFWPFVSDVSGLKGT